jgi:ribosome-associated toxin RatA of RatAB toxin-antitoxin module
MPQVSLDRDVRAPADQLWQAILDVERYPDSMASVRWVRVVSSESEHSRRIAWSVSLKGSILEWEEDEQIDHQAMSVKFHQVSGDMEWLEGEWRLTARGPTLTQVTLRVSFEIGIPLLAEMLNPVAERSFHENCDEMLRGIEREALAA